MAIGHTFFTLLSMELNIRKYFLLAAIAAPIVFWTTTFVCGLILSDYNHLRNLVSELGAIGTRTQFLFTTGLLLTSILSILFIIGSISLLKEKKIPTLPVWVLTAFSFSIAGAAIFPMPTRLHFLLGSPSFLLFFSPIIALFIWKKNQLPLAIKAFALLTLLIMSLGFLIYAENLMAGYQGLKQRFFHLGWTIWFISLSYIFLKKSNDYSN